MAADAWCSVPATHGSGLCWARLALPLLPKRPTPAWAGIGPPCPASGIFVLATSPGWGGAGCPPAGRGQRACPVVHWGVFQGSAHGQGKWPVPAVQESAFALMWKKPNLCGWMRKWCLRHWYGLRRLEGWQDRPGSHGSKHLTFQPTAHVKQNAFCQHLTYAASNQAGWHLY
jgi:hypothetical protein